MAWSTWRAATASVSRPASGRRCRGKCRGDASRARGGDRDRRSAHRPRVERQRLGNTHEKIVDETYRRDISQGFPSYYDETKHLAHVAARELISSGAPVLIAMPGTTYGPGDHSAMGSQLRLAYEGRLRVTGLTDVGISTHVDDVAGGIIATLSQGRIGELYIPAGRNMRLREALEAAAAGRWPSAAAHNRPDQPVPRDRALRPHRIEDLRPAAELRRGHRSGGRRDVLGLVGQGQPQAGLRAARSRIGHPRHVRRSAFRRGQQLQAATDVHSSRWPASSRCSNPRADTTARSRPRRSPWVGSARAPTPLRRHLDWIKSRLPSGDNYHDLKGLLRGLNLNTVCEEAHCPNIGECWDQRTATIMILGDTCTRACGFCAVKTGRPTWFDDDEPRRVAEAVAAMRLEHVVVTRSPATTCRTAARRSSPKRSSRCASAVRDGGRGAHPRLRRLRRPPADRHGGAARSSTTTSRP